MKFKFPFHTLLKHREIAAQEAKREYFQAKNIVDETNQEINNYWQSIDDSREKVAQLQQGDDPSMDYVESFDAFIKGQLIKIDRAKDKLREQLVIMEAKQDALVEAGREQKILERLKEKMKVKFKKAQIKKERKEIDDIVTMGFKRRKYGQGL